MVLHFSAIFTVTLLTGIAILLYRFFFLNLESINRLGISVFLFSLMTLSLRLLFPVEFSFMITIPVEWGMPTLTRFLAMPMLRIGSVEITVLSILCAIWVVVSVVLFVRMVVCYREYRSELIVTSRPVNVFELTQHTLSESDTEALLGLIVVQSDLVQSPMILGQIKPIIVLPSISLSPCEWGYVLRHEINHHRHGDLWIKVFMKIIQVVYWWNPVVYVLGRLISELLEIRNDKELIALMSEEEKIAYYECLLKVAKSRTQRRKDRLALSFDSAKKNVALRRIRLIDSDRSKYSRRKGRITRAMIGAIATATVLSFFVVFESSSMPSADAEGNYRLKQDNSYIVINDNRFDIYLEDEYKATVSVVPDSLLNLRIYSEEEIGGSQ